VGFLIASSTWALTESRLETGWRLHRRIVDGAFALIAPSRISSTSRSSGGYLNPGGAHLTADDLPGKLIGVYCIILALTMMRYKQSAVATMNALIRNPPLLLLVEMLGLAAGLAMVLGHNIWSGGALPVVVTLVGWLMAIRGIVLLALPQDQVVRGSALLRAF
jgi:hypothetical protein